jgi:urea transport system ATP-binding protein
VLKVEGIQPSIIKEIGRVIAHLREQRGTAILLVEQYVDFASALADVIAAMDRGEIVARGRQDTLDAAALRRLLTI